ncbi:MAG: mechanosensitive ion channel [Phycisphaerales bacterium]|nr:mechanosensitive ion channel [Phycisphaerales bacterium]
MQAEQTETLENAADTTAEIVEPSTAEGFGDLVSRITSGDMSTETWILAWETVGRPVLLAIVLIIAVFIAAGWARKLVGKAVRKANVEETLARFLSNIARYIVLIAGGVAILGTLGIETASFAAVLAAVGFAIGMAMSGMLGNIAAGVMLLLFRPFKVGDVVDAGGVKGKVFEIGLFTTVFDTPDNRRIIVPNNSIFGDNIENVSHHDTRRVTVAVGTEYGADIDKAREVLMEAAKNTPSILEDPAPVIYLKALGGSSIDWDVRVWVKREDFWDVQDRLTRDVKYALDNAGIGIPFPQMDVHIDGTVSQS